MEFLWHNGILYKCWVGYCICSSDCLCCLIFGRQKKLLYFMNGIWLTNRLKCNLHFSWICSEFYKFMRPILGLLCIRLHSLHLGCSFAVPRWCVSCSIVPEFWSIWDSRLQYYLGREIECEEDLGNDYLMVTHWAVWCPIAGYITS